MARSRGVKFFAVTKVLQRIQENASSKGLNGTSTGWLVVWILVMGWRAYRRFGNKADVVVTEKLVPGQRIVIEHYPKGITFETLAAGDRT